MIKVFNRGIPTRGVLFYVVEDLLIWISAFVSAFLFDFPSARPFSGEPAPFFQGLILISIFHLCFYYGDLYDLCAFPPDGRHFFRLLQAGGSALFVLGAVLSLFPGWRPAPGAGGVLFPAVILSLSCVIVWRNLFGALLKRSKLEDRVLILGTQEAAVKVAQEVLKKKGLGFNLIGFLDEDRTNVGRSLINPKIIGAYENLPSIVAKRRIDQVVIAAPERRGRLPIQALLSARALGVEFIEGARFYEEISGKVFLEDIRPSDFIYSRGFGKSGFARSTKRATGVAVSLAILLLTFPLFILLAVLIKLDSRGPVFYRQEREGEEGKIFTLLKFRSMGEDAEIDTGPVWAEERDPRVTRVGRIMRKTRLDELPQILNVLKGEMSFVGPRPERPFFVEKLSHEIPFYALRLSVKPGVTGWAQIRYPYGASVEDAKEKLRYDLYYIKHMSLLFDLLIIFRTIKIVFCGRGGR